jgi:hypothetical protein
MNGSGVLVSPDRAEQREAVVKKPRLKTCEQCGRIGTRGFTLYPATAVWRQIVVCANVNACRKRWPKAVTPDD